MPLMVGPESQHSYITESLAITSDWANEIYATLDNINTMARSLSMLLSTEDPSPLIAQIEQQQTRLTDLMQGPFSETRLDSMEHTALLSGLSKGRIVPIRPTARYYIMEMLFLCSLVASVPVVSDDTDTTLRTMFGIAGLKSDFDSSAIAGKLIKQIRQSLDTSLDG